MPRFLSLAKGLLILPLSLPLVPRCSAGRPSAIQLGIEPGTTCGALRQLAGKPPDYGARDDAPATPRFEIGQRLLGIGNSGSTSRTHRHKRLRVEAVVPEIRCHPSHLPPNLALVTAVDGERDETEACMTDSVVQIEPEPGHDRGRTASRQCPRSHDVLTSESATAPWKQRTRYVSAPTSPKIGARAERVASNSV
jgi:hypothetical protein